MINHELYKNQNAKNKNRTIHMTSYSTISTMDWQGIHSQKFKGNRSHKCVPENQLDFKLQSIRHNQRSTGRRHFEEKISKCSQEPFKKHMKTFQMHYKSKILDFPLQPKLIKIYNQTRNKSVNPVFLKTINPKKQSLQFLGMSKIKALQRGQKTTGIYRNFYKSRENNNQQLKQKSKSSNIFPSKIYETDYQYQ